jgi:hypothetical protein
MAASPAHKILQTLHYSYNYTTSSPNTKRQCEKKYFLAVTNKEKGRKQRDERQRDIKNIRYKI